MSSSSDAVGESTVRVICRDSGRVVTSSRRCCIMRCCIMMRLYHTRWDYE